MHERQLYLPDIAPADRFPRAASFNVPAGAWDCHAHVFGPVKGYPLSEPRLYTPPEQLTSAYLDMLDATGLARGVLSQPSVYGTDNSCLIDALKESGGRLRGIAVLDLLGLRDAELEAMNAAGVRGVRMNVSMSCSALSNLADIDARLEELGWHVELLLDKVEALIGLAHLLMRLKAPVVVEQMGSARAPEPVDGPGFLMLRALLKDSGVWCKLSHAYKISRQPFGYTDVLPFARRLVEEAPEQLIWGSDWPHTRVPGPMPNDGFLLDLLWEWLDADTTVASKVLVENPARLYGRKPRG